jgi:hypothetical protein
VLTAYSSNLAKLNGLRSARAPQIKKATVMLVPGHGTEHIAGYMTSPNPLIGFQSSYTFLEIPIIYVRNAPAL